MSVNPLLFFILMAIAAVSFVVAATFLLLVACEFYKILANLRIILTETRATLAGFFPRHIDDSLDKPPSAEQETYVHAPETWDEGKSGRD